jgi:ABC-type phosphate/phosphonate transport system substrate-binding protein
VALRGDGRDDRAVFFVREKSTLRHLGDLRGKIVAFGTPWSTAGYALAKAELKKIKLSMREWTDEDAPGEAVRYRFAGEPVNQAFLVIRRRADAGVISSGDWEALPPKEQSRLRIIHRTASVTRLFGSFHPLFPPVLREVVAQALVDMSGNGKGRDALTRALNMTAFDRLTEEDRNSLLVLKKQLQEPD